MANISHFTQTVNGVSATYDIHDAGAIPRSGGAVLDGKVYSRTVDSDYLALNGSSTDDNGAFIRLHGKDYNDANYSGCVLIRVKDNINVYDLYLNPNGTAMWGNKNLAMQEDVIPRSGGAVMTGHELSQTSDSSYFMISGGTSGGSGNIVAYGRTNQSTAGCVLIHADNGYANTDYLFYPDGHITLGPNFSFNADGGFQLGSSSSGLWSIFRRDGVIWNNSNHFIPLNNMVIDLGGAGNAWKDCFLANSPTVISDIRQKTQIQDIDDALLDAWGSINPKTYKMVSAVEKKGEKARYHIGYIAQDIQAECEKQGVNASDYGLFCYDEWEEQEEVSEEIETEKDGKKVKEKRVIQPKREKGNSYALRYEEALVVECKYLRRRIERLEARLARLENPEESQEKGADK